MVRSQPMVIVGFDQKVISFTQGVDYIRSQMDFLVCTFARDRGSSPMCFPLCVSLFIFVQIRIKQKAALQSVHLNAFAHVCFIFHFLSK